MCFNAGHLRAGDIFYGIYKDFPRFSNKCITFQIASGLIQKANSDGRKVILFGQYSNLISHLCLKHEAYSSNSFFEALRLASPLEEALADIFLMKSANTIYSGSSGFALFSSLSSNTPHVMAKNHYTFADLKPLFFDGASTSKLLCDGIDSAQSIFSLRWVLSHFYMYLDQAETDFLCEVGLS